MTNERAKVVILTALAILAFAANSLLTRRALVGCEIAPGVFVAIRLISGAVMLVMLGARRPGTIVPGRSDVGGIACLLIYAVAFTFAYIRLGAAVGALILFPTVQLTLVTLASLRGSLPSRREALGSFTALAGIGLPVDPKQKVPFWLLHRSSTSDPRVRRMIDLRFAGGTDHARMADTLSRLAKAAR